jgi:4-hydroxybenzoate polyprenyltransferase
VGPGKRANGAGIADWLRALRPHQWAKNLLLFVPLALTPSEWTDVAKGGTALIAFGAWCLVASAGYVLNDLLDLEADRRHPLKSGRPFASGALSLRHGVALFGVLVTAGFAIASGATPARFTGILAVYLVVTTLYSVYFKRLLLVDVIVLAGLYTLRVIGGASAASISLTPWLLAFSLFIFLSLAFVKRYSELDLHASRSENEVHGRAYRVEDLDLVLVLGSASGYLSVLVLCLYINSEAVGDLYRTVEVLWCLVPILLYWISRIWFLAKRGELPGDPVAFAVRDPASWASGGLAAAVVAAAIL